MNEVWYRKVSYEDAKDLVKESLSNTVGAFITAGYWLKYIRDQKEYEKEGYSSLWEMAEKEFGLKESEASRAMGMNDRYSLDGNSPFMLEKYCGYNKSQLQEMLTMTEEQLEQVTTDMKVYQMRQLKKTGATEEQQSVAMSQEPVITGSEVVFEEENSEMDVEVLQGIKEDAADVLLETEIVEEIEGEEEEQEAILEFEILDDEEDAEELEIIIDGEFREIPLQENKNTEMEEAIVAAEEENELLQVKKILEKENELLDEYLKIDDLPVFTVKRQKLIVGALANMVCELDEMEQKAEMTVQPELPILKNNDQRQEFIAAYESWPLWLEQPLTGERYYRYDFSDGTAFVVKVYYHKCFDIYAHGRKWEDRYKDDWGAEEYYIMTEGKHFKDCLTNRSSMIEFLKRFQKGEK